MAKDSNPARFAVYAPVRRSGDDGHEFSLFSEMTLSPWLPPQIAPGMEAWNAANPIVRVQRFKLVPFD